MNLKILEECKKEHTEDTDNEIKKYTNKFLKDITNNLEGFSYNKIIANMHEMYSFLTKRLNKPYKKNTLIENFEKILISITPIIPHFTSECLTNLNNKNISWPEYDEEILIEDYVNLVVQINGKKRGLIKTKKDNNEKIIMREISKEKSLEKYIKDQKIQKTIFIQNKLINIII